MRQLQPKFVAKPWGATSLAPLFPEVQPGEPIGEVWFDEPGHPLLFKFLFTTKKLSVQSHPDEAYSAAHASEPNPPRPKTEMWHILAAEPGAKIAAGLATPLSPSEFRADAESGAIEGLLQWHDARPGDTFFIPAGTVHAIGEGLVLCEIQQNSDTTYRLYDYGRGRELHLDEGVAVSVLAAHPGTHASAPGTLGSVLADCPFFHTERIQVHGPVTLPASPEQTIVILSGAGEIGGQQTKAGEVWRGSEEVVVSGQLTLLRVMVPRS